MINSFQPSRRRASASCRASRQGAQSRGQSRQEAMFCRQLSREETRDRGRTVSAKAKYDGQSRQEAKIGGLVYSQCIYSDELFIKIQVIGKIKSNNKYCSLKHTMYLYMITVFKAEFPASQICAGLH